MLVRIVAASEAAAHAGDLLAERRHALQHGVDEVAVLFEVRAAFLGDRVELLGAFRLRGDVAGLLEKGQRRIHHAGTRRVPARGLVLQHLDDLVAVARLLGDQPERDQPQIAGREHAAGAHHVAAAHAVPSADAAAEMAPPAASARPMTGLAVSHSKHRGLLLKVISLDTA